MSDAVESLKPLGVSLATAACVHGGYRAVRWYIPSARQISQHDLGDSLVLAPGLGGTDEALRAVLRELESAGARAVVVAHEPSMEMVPGIPVLVAPADVDWAEVFAAVDVLLVDGRGEGTDSDDLTQFANELAVTCGGHVAIADRTRRLISWSSIGELDASRKESLVGRMTPDDMASDMRRDGSWQRLASGEITQYYGSSEDGRRLRLGIAVRAGAEVLGFLSVLPEKDADIEHVKDGLRLGARVAVPCLVRYLAYQGSARISSIQPLLDGGGVPTQTLARLGMARSTDFVVAAMTAGTPDRVSPLNVASRVRLTIEARKVAAGVALIDDVVYVLVGATGSGADAAARRLVGSVVAELRAHGVAVLAALGGPVARLADVGVAREQADLVLAALREDPSRGPMADLASMRGVVVIDQLRVLTAPVAWLFDGAVAALQRHDAATTGELLLTFQTWLRAGRSGRAAAKALGMHPSSLASRLDRIWAVTQLSPDDYEGLLVAELELAIGRVRCAGAQRRQVKPESAG